MAMLEILANGETRAKAEEFNIQQKEAVVASGLEHDESKEVRYGAFRFLLIFVPSIECF